MRPAIRQGGVVGLPVRYEGIKGVPSVVWVAPGQCGPGGPLKGGMVVLAMSLVVMVPVAVMMAGPPVLLLARGNFSVVLTVVNS